MTAKCVGCELDWNVSIYQKIPRTGYICPHCESRLRAGETLPNIQASHIPDAHCNGDMHAALDYAAKIKHAQKDFLTSQGIHAIID